MMSAGTIELPAGSTVATARRLLTSEFRARAMDTPGLDARILVAHALGLDHAALAAQGDRPLAAAEVAVLTALAARRLKREPVARILGLKEFWGLALRLNAETLVPRPETETVVEAALAALTPERRQLPLRVADLGTGSGALLLALLTELPAALGIGTDQSLAALACARSNARTLGLGERAAFIACDYGAALAGPLDVVVSNPPYVAHGEIAALAPEVRDFDPSMALDGGPDGLAGYRAIAAGARRLIAPHGLLVVELGAGQLGMVTAIFSNAGFAVEPPRHDLAGIARALVVKPLPEPLP
jgi:release factor glutamine methyltransferase